MKRFLVLLLLTLASASCSSTSGPDAGDVLGLSSGTSFGMCLGYCTTELVMDSATVWLTESSRDSVSNPTRRRSLTLSTAEWERLSDLADAAALQRVAGVNGCPDCADGGAEWIEMRFSQGVIRSTFEHGAVLEPIAELQAEIRAIRRRFE